MWIMVSGPYTSGARDDAEREANLLAMNLAAVELLKAGHVPIIGVNMALPVIHAAGPQSFDSVMMLPFRCLPSVEGSAEVSARIDLLRQRAEAGECDLVAKAGVAEEAAGFLYVGSGRFAPDRRGQPPLTDAALRSLAPVTYTCVPPGSGVRIGVDRDGDGAWDGDERQANTDPADPASGP